MSGVEWARVPGGIALDGGRLVQTLADWVPPEDAVALRAMAGRVPVELAVGVPLIPEMHNPDHDEPFALFVQAMADELRANAGKGDRAAWLADNPGALLSEIHHHLAKLHVAANELMRHRNGMGIRPTPWGGTRSELESLVKEFAADTANMALMLADNMAVLNGDVGE